MIPGALSSPRPPVVDNHLYMGPQLTGQVPMVYICPLAKTHRLPRRRTGRLLRTPARRRSIDEIERLRRSDPEQSLKPVRHGFDQPRVFAQSPEQGFEPQQWPGIRPTLDSPLTQFHRERVHHREGAAVVVSASHSAQPGRERERKKIDRQVGGETVPYGIEQVV